MQSLSSSDEIVVLSARPGQKVVVRPFEGGRLVRRYVLKRKKSKQKSS